MALIAGLIGLAILIAKRERVVSFCILWFFVNLAIESSVLPLELVYEHRTYLPSMFFFLLLLYLGYRHIRRHWALSAVACGLLLLLCLWTYQRNALWQDPVRFWKDCVSKSDNKGRPHLQLGLALARRGDFEEAIVHYQRVLQIVPRHRKAYYNLGNALDAQGRLEEAIVHYSSALQLSPRYAAAHNNLGITLHKLGRFDEAVKHFSQALELETDFAEAHNNLGVTLAAQGKFKEAIAHYIKAVEIHKYYADAHNNLGVVLAKYGKLKEAKVCFSTAVQIKPDFTNAHRNLTQAYWLSGDRASAMREYEIVKSLDVESASELFQWMNGDEKGAK